MESSGETQWIVVDDEMITKMGYKNKGNNNHDRDSLFRVIKKNYENNTDYKFSNLKRKKTGSGPHNKLTLEMTQSAYEDLVLKTREVRMKKIRPQKHFIYVLHNPVFLHYGPNVYKIGYSTNVKDRLKSYSTYYIQKSRMLYSKEVTSKECEAQLHDIMAAYRVEKNREFFDCPLSQVKEFIESL